MEKFYVIKVINKEMERGYIIDTPAGVKISKGGMHSDVTQFSSFQEAQEFIRSHNLESKGTKAYILDNDDIIKDVEAGVKAATKPLWVILQVPDGQKLHYNSAQDGYYFKDQHIGACVWESERDAKAFIAAYGLNAIAEELKVKK